MEEGGGKIFLKKWGLLERGGFIYKGGMSGNALTLISNKQGVFFKKNCKRMKIKLISVGCNCLVHHFD